jgi:hypothetical protein
MPVVVSTQRVQDLVSILDVGAGLIELYLISWSFGRREGDARLEEE